MSQPDSNLADLPGGGVLERKPKSNVYTVLLVLSLLALLFGCLFLWLEIKAYNGQIKGPVSYLTTSVDAPSGAVRIEQPQAG